MILLTTATQTPSFLSSISQLAMLITIHPGEGGWFFIFRLFKSILFFVNRISLYFFHFYIKLYHIMFIIIVIWLGCDRPAGLFFRASFASFYTHASLLTFFVCFIILFGSCCSHARVFGKTLWMSSPFPIAILNGTCFFPTVQLQVHNVYLERKTRNSCALVNLCL